MKLLYNSKWLDTIIRIALIVFFAGYLISEYPDYKLIASLTGEAVALAVSMAGLPVTIWNNYMLVEYSGLARVFSLSAECAGVIVLSIFLFPLFITPQIALKNRLIGLLFIPLLFFGNVLRIALDIVAGAYISAQDVVLLHNTLGQVFIFGWAILTFYLYLRYTGQFPSLYKDAEKYREFFDGE